MKITKKIIAVFLSVIMLFSAFSVGLISVAENENENENGEIASTLPFIAISDIHYYPQSYTGDRCEAWQEFCTTDTKEYEESEALVYAALDTIKKRVAEGEEIKYVLIPGDLTKDSEYQAHVELAAILEKFETDTGIEVFVTNGNHDINVYDACTFENGKMEDARCITQAEFKEVYKNFGFEQAESTYSAEDGSYNNGLSYAVNLDENYKLIVVDSCLYDPVNPAKQQTGGMITEEAMNWVKDMAAAAKNEGRTPILMQHHSIAPHMELEPSITFAFCVQDYQWVAESYADAGIHYAFTGHLHTNDIASITSDNGNTIYDCEVGSLTGFPNNIREMKITTYTNGVSEMDYNILDVDYAGEVDCIDDIYSQYGSFKKRSFAINFGGRYSDDGYADVSEFFMGIVRNYLLPYVDKINSAGGINEFLKDMNIDLESILGDVLKPYIGDGIKIGGISILSTDNLMWFIEDLMEQVEELYINDPDKLMSVIENAVNKLVNFKMTDTVCTKFIDEYHFGGESDYGTLGDFVLSVMAYWYAGNEDISDDEFLLSAIDNIRNGDVVERLINLLLEVILDDLVDDAILSKLNIRIDKLFDPNCIIGKKLGCTADEFVKKFLRNDTSYMNLVNTIFSFGVLPYSSIDDIVAQLMDEYVTPSQLEALGSYIAYCAEDFATDSNPTKLGDYDVTYSSKQVEPEVSKENYRLPSMVNVTLGKDSTSANISWFTKETVDGSSIEIYSEDDFTGFTGTATNLDELDYTVTVTEEKTTVSYPGIDIGITGFLYYDYELNHYTATISGLEKGKTYYYRLGCEERDWWSETGSIRTQDGSDKVTFINVTDSQSQTKAQFERSWANVLKTSFNMYDVDLILHTGDNVDNPDNINQWQWLFDTASDEIMNTYYMPTSGNHENYGENAIVNKFVLSNLPEQDTTTGAYYSFDYNNIHFMVLNSNDLNENDALSDKQIEWLKADAKASSAQWKIVAIHKAIYSNGSHYDDDDVCAIRDQLSVLMPELDIDLVFQGHDHVYMRTYNLDSNKVTDTERVYLEHNGKKYVTDVMPTGTSYVICGTSGVKTYLTKDNSLTDELFPRAEAIVDVDSSMFSAVTVDGGVLYFDAYSVDGDNVKNVDSFAIQKDTNDGTYAGDCEDVSAADKNSEGSSLRDMFKKLLNFLTKIFTFITNIKNMYF